MSHVENIYQTQSRQVTFSWLDKRSIKESDIIDKSETMDDEHNEANMTDRQEQISSRPITARFSHSSTNQITAVKRVKRSANELCPPLDLNQMLISMVNLLRTLSSVFVFTVVTPYCSQEIRSHCLNQENTTNTEQTSR